MQTLACVYIYIRRTVWMLRCVMLFANLMGCGVCYIHVDGLQSLLGEHLVSVIARLSKLSHCPVYYIHDLSPY